MPAEQQRKSYGERMQKKRIARNLKAIRKSKHLTEMELAERSGYKSASVITGIENGSVMPSYEKIRDIATALNVSISQLKGTGKIELGKDGWPRLTESERTGIFLLAPIIQSLDDEQVDDLISYALLLCKAEGREPAWKKPAYEKRKQIF